MARFENRIAVVTGASSGIGLAVAARLAAEGAHVFITGRNRPDLDRAAAQIGPGSATAIAGDISNRHDLDRLYEAVGERGGGLDVLFANAASFGRVDLADVTDEDYERIFDVNVRGTLLSVQKALPLLNDGASVVLNASAAADRGLEGSTLYSSSKAAVRSFARTWAQELRGRGVRVNAVSPGVIDTPGVAKTFGEAAAQQAKEDWAAQIPTGRVGRSDEVGSLVAFLASDESTYITGANLCVDGGINQL